jgi:hypothetical protein
MNTTHAPVLYDLFLATATAALVHRPRRKERARATMALKPLVPNDPRVESKFFHVPGTDIRYHYLLGRPTGPATATILLLHGFPDLAMGWRYQVRRQA